MIIPPLTALTSQKSLTVFWFRRDLRLEDNHGLYRALQHHNQVLPLFIFDTDILDQLENPTDRRVQFIYEQVQNLKDLLEQAGSTLLVCYGTPVAVYLHLVHHLSLKAVYTNRDYEPYAQHRDQAVTACLAAHQVAFHSFKDQVIFEHTEVAKEDGTPYTVFTPYMKKWKALLTPAMLASFDSSARLAHCLSTRPMPLLSMQDMGFQAQSITFPSKTIDLTCIAAYDQRRDMPAVAGTSCLGVHFRFGTLSIRAATAIARVHNTVWLNELIWREFYMMILWHFPHVVSQPFKEGYAQIAWENDLEKFQAWCTGQTGYPIVDAGMRELNTTAYMHNRLRMITASFLTKHLLIDWRWGEAYFAKKLLDFELSSNNGGWQWAAGSGCDAAPYFRIFNPYLQAQKFDPASVYTRRWVPEFKDKSYPAPIVDHSSARARALSVYKKAVGRA